jgi:hypothetical protein
LALIILIAFLSIGVISASEINVNDTLSQDVSQDLLTVDTVDVGNDSSNILSINNVDTNFNDNMIGDNASAKKAVQIDAPDINLYYKNGTKFIATLSDIDGNKLANQTLLFTISGLNYTRTTDSAGQASIAINLLPGTYKFNVYYNGNENYLDSKTTAECTVYSTISGSDVVKYYKNDTQYYATFLDNQGNPLKGNVTFNINGVFYTRKTNDSGVARLNINLPDGEYILTAIHPDTGYMYSNNVTVLPTINGEDLTKVFRDSHQYYATFLQGDGTPLKNTDVQFNINGVFYTRTSNASGVAKLNINLPAGTYILTAIHPNDTYKHSNVVTVLGTSTTTMATSNYTYIDDDTKIIKATLYDQLGNVVPGQTIEATVNQATYINTTDDNGIATFDVYLTPGVYTIKYDFQGNSPYTSSAATSTITVKDSSEVSFEVNNTVIYYNNKESFNVRVLDINEKPIVNQPVYFRINGIDYIRNTNSNGVAKININLDPGVYEISYKFNSTHYKELTESSQIDVIDGNTSILSGSDITIGYGSGERFYVQLCVGDVGLPERTVILNINGVDYTRITDEDGFASIAINLQPGQYVIKYSYAGEDRINPSSGQAKVTVKPRTATSLSWKSATSFIKDSEVELEVLLVDANGKPLSDKDVMFNILSKDFFATTDSQGLASIFKTFSSGSYVVSYAFDGDTDYLPCNGATQITVSKAESASGYGYWVQGKDMNSVDLAKLASLGTTDILLNFYAFKLYGEDKVVSWIQSARSNGINVHIWMQAFYDGGWINPISGGSINTTLFNELISEAKYYAGLKGVAGVHLDYLRYPGTAYKTTGGTAAITEFVKEVTAACRAVNPNIIMSAAVMPETTNNIYYYGQDVPAISKYLDVLIPMQYKGNYNTGTNWLASTTKWFVDNSNGAEIWSGLQSYLSDSNTAKLSYNELFNDAQTVVSNGADGVMLFRFGLSNFLNFKDLEDPSYGDVIKLDDVLDAAIDLKDYIEEQLTLPTKVEVGLERFSTPQMLSLMTQALKVIDSQSGDIVSLIVDEPENSTGNIIHSQLSKNEYLNVTDVLDDYMTLNKQAPDFISTHIGDIKYETLVYMYARILDFYAIEGRLPEIVVVNNFLDDPTLTVNMLPSYSTAEYQYVNYTTTWLNYCPKCGYYGTLLINPKGTYEGELTCAFCDSDYCGVTGHDKLLNSDYVLTRLSDSVPVSPGGAGDSVSIASIVEGAIYIAEYYNAGEEFPDYVVVNEGKYTMQQFLYLMSKAIVQINASNFSPVTLINMSGPSTPAGDVINGSLSKKDYLDVVTRVGNFISSNKLIPNYASSTLGKIAYSELVDSFSRILQYYGDNGALPSSVHIVYSSGSSKSISELSKSLIKGLTSDRDKAVALYNYVRDYISYSFYYNTQKGAEGTLTSGSGNCCDQAQLLVAMARSVGLTARFATGYCTFSSGTTYGHVWAQFNIDGSWINADPTSTRNSFGVINNWNTASYTNRGTFDVLPY